MSAKSPRFKLLGWSVFHPFRLTLTQQIHDILCREIHAGRWNEGEQLPSIGELSKESGIGQTPVWQAYEMLRNEGYVRQNGRKGTILITVSPEGVERHSVIGVAAVSQPGTDTETARGADSLHFHTILEDALKRHYVTEVVCLNREDDWTKITTRTGPFSDRVQGIISLHPFPYVYPSKQDRSNIPIVFLLDPTKLRENVFEVTQPVVTGDLYSGFYELTKHVLSFGHRNIVFFANNIRSSEYTQTCWRAHKRAMEEAGLKANKAALEKSMALPARRLTSAKEFIETFNDATAVICETMMSAHNLIEVADLHGIKVPENLSIVTQGYGYMRIGEEKHSMTCLQYDIPRAIDLCLDMLLEQIKTGTCSIRNVMVRPIIVEGESISPPSEKAMEAKAVH